MEHRTPVMAHLDGAPITSPEPMMHSGPYLGDMNDDQMTVSSLSSRASSEEFHRYSRLYGHEPDVEEADLAGTRRRIAYRTTPAVEALDTYGDPIAVQLPVSTATPPTRGFVHRVMEGGAALVGRLVFGQSPVAPTTIKQQSMSAADNEPAEGNSDVAHDPFEENEHVNLYYTMHPDRMPLSVARNVIVTKPDEWSSGPFDSARGSSSLHRQVPGSVRLPSYIRWDHGDDSVLRAAPGFNVDDLQGGMELDLTTAIRRYVTCPNEYYGNMVDAVLAARDPVADPVVWEELQETMGNSFLVQRLVQSGALAAHGDEAVAIGRLLQQYINALVVADPELGRVAPSSFQHLRCMLQVPTSRLTAAQASLLQRSGFEFVLLTSEFSHLEPKDTLLRTWHRLQALLGRRLDFPLTLIGLGLVCLDFISLVIVGLYWYRTSSTYGYITVLCFVGGYVADLFTMLLLVRNKANHSVYEARITPFPSVNLKMFPLVPMYDFVLFQSLVRHEWDAWKNNAEQQGALHSITGSATASGGGVKNKHAAMIHDLYATSSILRVTHSVFYSVPQVVLQSYFFDWGTLGEGSSSYYGYKMILFSSIACVVLALILIMRQLTVFDSVSYLGYASFGTDSNCNIVRRRSVVPRTLTFALVYLFEVNLFFLIIGSINRQTCSTNTKVWIAMSAGVVATSLLIFLASFKTSTSVHRAAKWFIVPLMFQCAFTVFITVRSADTGALEECKLFVKAGTTTLIVGYVSWGVFSFFALVWLATSRILRLLRLRRTR